MSILYHGPTQSADKGTRSKMKPVIRVAFAHFWRGFGPEQFRNCFPFVYEKYDLLPSTDPEIVFYSVFSPKFHPHADARSVQPWALFPPGRYLRVFLTGENCEPDMT